MLSKRFISAYNTIDKKLRALFNVRANATFAETVRICAPKNALIRKYEDDLGDFGRLRNAIVHNSNTDMVIAEPHADVVEKIEHIAQVLSCPPSALKTVAKRAVCVNYDKPIAEVITLMAKGGYSNIPVLKRGGIIGVASNKLIVEFIAEALEDGGLSAIQTQSIERTLKVNGGHYVIVKKNITVDNALLNFTQNRKLQLMILTDDGTADSDIAGVISTGDVIDMNRILEDY